MLFRSIFRPLVWTIFLITSAGLTLTSCPTQPSNPPDPATLSVEYTTCTEVWLRIQIPDSTSSAGLRVYRGDSLVVQFSVAPADTVMIDTGLTPNTTYIYNTVRFQENHEQSPGEPLSVTTLPTTSHNFTWTIDTLGNYGSYLNDVAIVDEDNIWAVGEINADSGAYNAARWDGEQWDMVRIAPAGYFGPITAVYAFSSDDIWFGKYGLAFHYDGTDVTRYEPTNSSFPGMPSINAICGTSSSNLYFVGRSGTIVHYDGQQFTQEESGTTVDLRAVAGSPDGQSVWACGYTGNFGASVLLHKRGDTWQPVWTWTASADTGTLDYPAALWFDQHLGVMVGDRSAFWQPVAGPVQFTPDPFGFQAFPYAVDGAAINDLLVAGDLGYVWHYNGQSWQTWHFFPGQFSLWRGSALLGNTAVAVGAVYENGLNRAAIARGYR